MICLGPSQMKDAKTLLLEFLAAVTHGQNAAALFAEDGAVELPFLHSLGIPWRHRGLQAISELHSEAVRTKGLVDRRLKGQQEGTNMKLQGNVLERNSIRFAAGLLAALASFVAGPNAALAAAPQHHDQAPGFYRLKVGDLEVTALYDGTGVFDPHWLNGTKATMDGVVKGLHEDPHMLDVVDTGFLVNTGKQLILVDAGAGIWWGGGALGRLAGSLRSAGYSPEEVDLVLLTHLHSDHVGGLTTQDGKRVFPNADVYVAKAESDFWLSPEVVDLVLLTHLHSDHVGGLTTQDGKRVFPNAEVYVAKAESDFWLSPE